MSFFNYLLISVLLIPFSGSFNSLERAGSPCEMLGISHTVTIDQKGKYTLTIAPKGGIGKYKLFIWDERGDLLTEDFTKREFKNLSAGRYAGIVGDENKCVKKFEIVIP